MLSEIVNKEQTLHLSQLISSQTDADIQKVLKMWDVDSTLAKRVRSMKLAELLVSESEGNPLY